MTTAEQERLVDVETVGGSTAVRAPIGVGKTFRAYDPSRCC